METIQNIATIMKNVMDEMVDGDKWNRFKHEFTEIERYVNTLSVDHPVYSAWLSMELDFYEEKGDLKYSKKEMERFLKVVCTYNYKN